MTDDLGGKATTAVQVWWRFHAASLAAFDGPARHDHRDNAGPVIQENWLFRNIGLVTI
jgi:hypothetical protein